MTSLFNIDGRREAVAIEAISAAIQAILNAPVENETMRAALKVLESRSLPPQTSIVGSSFYGHLPSDESLPGDEDDGEVDEDDGEVNDDD